MNTKCIRSLPSNSFIHLFSHSSCCLTTGPQHLPKQDIHSVWSSVSYFNLQYPFPSLRSSIGCSCLLLRLCPFFPPFLTSVMCIGRQFLHKMWQIQLAFLPFIVCRIFLSSLILCNTSSLLTWLAQMIFFILLQHHIPKLSRYFWSTFWSVQVSAPYKAIPQM